MAISLDCVIHFSILLFLESVPSTTIDTILYTGIFTFIKYDIMQTSSTNIDDLSCKRSQLMKAVGSVVDISSIEWYWNSVTLQRRLILEHVD